MNAPVIWILLPLGLSGLIWLPQRGRIVAGLGSALALLLAGFAWLIPIDVALRLGPLSLKIAPSMQVLGRSFILDAADQPILTLIYILTALWFFGSEAAGIARRMVPLGLAVTALLIGSLAVEPFLYAALLIEMAVLLAVPLLSPFHQVPGRGIVRFLIYQTLAMPFILFSGWLLAGVEASPADLLLTAQAGALLGLGFAFLCAIFPLYSWIPMLMEESSPYAVGFILWILPAATLLFGSGFIDRYAWLRLSPQLLLTLRSAGLLMTVTGGIWTAFQHHLGRMMGYAAIVETGFALLALSLGSQNGILIFFMFFIPRALGLAVWALALSTIKSKVGNLDFSTVQGIARAYPVGSIGLVIAHLSGVGFPLLAGFPVLLVLWQGLAHVSIGVALWFCLGILGLFIGAVRTLAVLVMSRNSSTWGLGETRQQAILIGLGVIALFLLGLFPQVVQPLIVNLASAYEHLGH